MVTVEDIANELGRPAPEVDSPTYKQWEKWIDRAYRAIRTRAAKVGIPYDSLDPDTVDDVVVYAVARRASRPVDGPESATDIISVDDGSVNRTRRYTPSQGDVFILDDWWCLLGLDVPAGQQWSGSVTYSR